MYLSSNHLVIYSNVVKTMPKTTQLGIVYTTYKNGDLGDDILSIIKTYLLPYINYH